MICYNGEKITLAEFCEETGISYVAFVSRRLKKGMSASDILTEWEFLHKTPPNYIPIGEAAKQFGITQQSVKNWSDKKKVQAKKVGNKWFVYRGLKPGNSGRANGLYKQPDP